jgi:hypothetical protein
MKVVFSTLQRSHSLETVAVPDPPVDEDSPSADIVRFNAFADIHTVYSVDPSSFFIVDISSTLLNWFSLPALFNTAHPVLDLVLPSLPHRECHCLQVRSIVAVAIVVIEMRELIALNRYKLFSSLI